MRENRQSGSEGGGTETNRSSLPLSDGDPLGSFYQRKFEYCKPAPGGAGRCGRTVTVLEVVGR